MPPVIIKEKNIFKIFEIGLILKGLNAIAEIAGGFFIWFVNKAYIITFVLDFTRPELSDDPKDYLANFIVNSAATFSTSSQSFFAFYLIVHGFIKIFLIVNLFRKRLWAYPVSIFIFTVFIIYQAYEYYLNNSPWILFLIFFDILIVLMTTYEFLTNRKNLRRGF